MILMYERQAGTHGNVKQEHTGTSSGNTRERQAGIHGNIKREHTGTSSGNTRECQAGTHGNVKREHTGTYFPTVHAMFIKLYQSSNHLLFDEGI